MNMDSSIRDRNLDALKRRGQGDLADSLAAFDVSDDLEVGTSRTGTPYMKLRGKSLNSLYDPHKEAETLYTKLFSTLDPSRPTVIVGSGMGYFVDEVIEKLNPQRIVLVDPVPAVPAKALSIRDRTACIERVEWIVGADAEALAEEVRETLGDEVHTAQTVITPSFQQAAPKEVEAFTQAFVYGKTRPAAASTDSLRILLVGPVYGGTLPVAGYIQRALEMLGHTVEWLDFSPLHDSVRFFDQLTPDRMHQAALQGQYTHLMSQGILARAQVFQPQLVFFVAQSPGTPEILEELRKAGVPTAMWFMEDGDLFEYGLKMAPHYDVFFHIQKGTFEEKLKAAGVQHVHYLPMAADPNVHRPLDLTDDEKQVYGSDISHVGAGYFNRRSFFPLLLDYDFKLWGSDWEQAGNLERVLQRNGERISTEESVKIFNASRINLNLHSSTTAQGVNPFGDFVNPRTFEVAACKAFQLVDERSLLADLFEPGLEIVTFKDLSECRKKISYYLDHPDEASRVAEAGYKRALSQHTYVHRMSEAVDVITKTCRIPESVVRRNTVSTLVEEAGDNQELVKLLQSMGDPNEEVTLEHIADKIRHGDGDLSETEAVFLLMDEFHKWAKEKGVA